MSSPVVVQGTAVKNDHYNTTTTSFGVSSGGNENYGNQQNAKQSTCNDPLFVVAFLIAVVGIVVTAGLYAPGALSSGSAAADNNNANANDDATTDVFTGYIIVATAIAILSFVGAGCGMAILMCIPQFLIKVSLVFTTALAGIMAVYSLMVGNYLAGGIGLLFFAISVCYACMVWKRIPFATANLVTGISAIRKNLCIAVVAYLFTILGVAWTIVWSLAMLGVSSNAEACDTSTGEGCGVNGAYTFLLLLALYFVQQVIQNSVHVTVAGTVATWWYSPQESGCGTVCNSFLRTITTSFGSICFGSLLVAIIQALRQMANQAQDDGPNALACVAQCILSCIQGIIEYFNKWAFVYVGIYGMNYIQAGKSVIELFQSRGWEAIIADDLVGNALLLVSLIVGVVMGGVGAALEATIDQIDDESSGIDSRIVAFLLGLVIGLVVTSILMSTIASSVNAVIVLFAEGPREFEQNHPELSRKMREVWASTYPTYNQNMP